MPMHSPWYEDLLIWLELAIFLALMAIIILLFFKRKRDRLESTYVTKPFSPANSRHRWQFAPELQLVMFGLPLQLLWEIAQFPLYTVWHDEEWQYILYGLIHCTLGDMLIMLSCYWVVALLNRNRNWYQENILVNGTLFTLLGLGYTIYSELLNVNIKSTWAYTALMPIIPVINIGGTPFMQWVLIPPVTLWLMRMYNPVRHKPN